MSTRGQMARWACNRVRLSERHVIHALSQGGRRTGSYPQTLARCRSVRPRDTRAGGVRRVAQEDAEATQREPWGSMAAVRKGGSRAASVAQCHRGRRNRGARISCVPATLSIESLQQMQLSSSGHGAVGQDMLCGIAACHNSGIAHRDIKPDNFMVSPASGIPGFAVKLCDFGLASKVSSPTARELRGVFGTPPFMAPEMLDDQAPAGRSLPFFSLIWQSVHFLRAWTWGSGSKNDVDFLVDVATAISVTADVCCLLIGRCSDACRASFDLNLSLWLRGADDGQGDGC